MTYVLLTEGMDGKQKAEFDDQLYGWSSLNQAGNRRLFGSGGE